MKLKSITITNFKGIKSLTADINGRNTRIISENGIGKTTVYVAFLWLLFGKDSTGRKEFGLHPYDKNNNVIKGLVSSVECTLTLDNNTNVTLRKESHERVVKDEVTGYETLCWIDEVPRKVGEYTSAINEIVSEDQFKLLTDVYFFNSKLTWQERRTILLEIAGDVMEPEGFEALIKACDGLDIDDYKKVLTDRKKKYEQERDGNNYRIDELSKNLGEDVSNAQLIAGRDKITADIAEVDIERQRFFADEHTRQGIVDDVNKMRRELSNLESDISNTSMDIAPLLAEKQHMRKVIADHEERLGNADRAIDSITQTMQSNMRKLDGYRAELNTIRAEKETIRNTPIGGTCFNCGQPLPQHMVDGEQARVDARIDTLNQQDTQAVNNGKAVKAIVEELNEKLKAMIADRNKIIGELTEDKKRADGRAAEIDAEIAEIKPADPKQDKRWINLVAKIKLRELDVPPSFAGEIEKLESHKSVLLENLTGINNELATYDRTVKDKQRIAELEAREKVIGNELTIIACHLADIQDYKQQQSELISQAVNGKFKHVTFKLFDELLNGSVVSCCEATLGGVPYADMSTGQEILVGIDIINVLSEYYGQSIPLFIDNSESMTLPIEATSQVISLRAVPGINELLIETE